MRLLRTIFIHHKRHLLNPKCAFSSIVSHFSTNSPELESSDTENRKSQPIGWSMYSNVFDAQQQRLSDHSDGEVEEEEKPSGRMLNLKKGQIRSIVETKKTGKVKAQWVCSNCGYVAGKWWGTCPSCGIIGTMKEFHEAKISDADNNKFRNGLAVSEDAVGLWLPQRPDQLHPIKLSEVNRGFNLQDWRIPLSGPFGDEVSTVLGGGLVPGSLTLVGGDPGVGKSTLLLQMAALIAGSGGEASPVVYVSGEESLQQIGHRADRLGIKSNIYLYSSTDIEDILKKAHCLSPRALVVDSIQTVYLKCIIGSVGGIVQVKECTSALMRFAKTTNIPVLLGERYTSHRMLRVVKNRFGSTDELGIFKMSQSGFCAVSNASEMFLTEQHSDSEVLAGLAITVIMDGSRTFVIEIQALCLSNNLVSVSSAKVLINQAGLHLQENVS
ncbi:P-loop containing nucleoside triphosphate hydrolase [Sesbania bispinosa]|nr:P-loop containing nucleoside triphosphate hydrolase [Sesbania bispinosa]